MSDPRHMHEFIPNKRGFCKAFLGRDGPCSQLENDPMHTRWIAKQKEEAQVRLQARAEKLTEVGEYIAGSHDFGLDNDQTRSDILSDIANMSRRNIEAIASPGFSGELVRAAMYLRMCVKSLKSHIQDHPGESVGVLNPLDIVELLDTLSVLLTNASNGNMKQFYDKLAVRCVSPQPPQSEPHEK